ncbi:hypothetical protein E1A91_A10G207600v1 [Gossypium mustelinum]|uniref:DNA-directed RNA polymerase n=1 Tax=Gossypium mustelinum TaxID=34275 RepID=A0A5D2XPJ3_GOSMU|nr:hypothetical protein E1A91_A10G207600v1 [Gossypium mustelinum]
METQRRKRPGQPPSVKELEELKELFKHHIESFDYMIDEGLEIMLKRVKPVQIFDPNSTKTLRIWLDHPEIFPPQKDRSSKTSAGALLPFECRQAKISYTGSLHMDVCFQWNGGVVIREKVNFGEFPIMLRSKRCYLQGANPEKLVACKEEAREMGGYFILNGLERVVRALILPKRNYPMSLERNSFRERREGYTEKAVVIRCVRDDLSSVTVKLYYLRNGSARLGFWIQGKEYMLPVGIVLKALIDTNDHEIYTKLTCCYNEKDGDIKGAVGSQLVGERAKIILDEVRHLALFTKDQCLLHIGEHFQPVMEGMETESYSSVADAVLRNHIFVHLNDNNDKFNLLIFMVQKLFSLVDQTSAPDNSDSLQNQEILLPGHLITIYLKEKLEDWLRKGKKLVEDKINNNGQNFDFCSLKDVKKVMDKNSSKQIGTAIENLLKTGRLITQTGLDLQQRAGFTVQAERLNYLRFISFFRSVHRGASFAGLRTTSVRKLLPESWGFLCPVHTPDGEPCGLLNHMTCTCRITSYYNSQGNIRDFFKIRMSILDVLVGVGMTTSWPKLDHAGPPRALPVLLDGCVIGSLSSGEADKVVAHLRRLKVSAASVIPDDLEVGYVPLSLGGTYPGLYLFTSPSRFIRPVRNISIPSSDGKDIEHIGPFEQVFMEIKCPDGGNGGRSTTFPATHEELMPTAMLSVVANLTPWSDHNQSPRNMYQCQMAKQTMAFSLQALHSRADQKLYHLQTPQTPIVRTKTYTKYGLDDYPSGTNAIVAVLAYTGYDMEDAMILNKSAVERGMCRGQIYQTETIDLCDGKSNQGQRIFKREHSDKAISSFVDSDGLPYVGQVIHGNEPYCSTINQVTNSKRVYNHKGSEMTIVDYVAVDTKNKQQLQKGGSLHGKFVDATPFSDAVKGANGKTETESESLVDELGSMLRARGFNYHGVEVLYSGVYGTELTCEIFIGPVYYQRLRHMVSDKYQVRATGQVDQITRQPIKGRKRGGGIRFGEMERDSMLAHGAAYLLHDRLHTCSDYHIADVCSLCGSILTTAIIQPQKRVVREVGGLPPARAPKKVMCHACQTSKGMETVAMPYVFRYLAAELAAMNIKMTIQLSSEAGA